MNMSCKLLAAVVLTVGVSSLAAPANAAPIAAPSSLRNAAMSSVETVQWRRRAWGPGIAALGRLRLLRQLCLRSRLRLFVRPRLRLLVWPRLRLFVRTRLRLCARTRLCDQLWRRRQRCSLLPAALPLLRSELGHLYGLRRPAPFVPLTRHCGSALAAAPVRRTAYAVLRFFSLANQMHRVRAIRDQK
jgi:hypothetical protein